MSTNNYDLLISGGTNHLWVNGKPHSLHLWWHVTFNFLSISIPVKPIHISVGHFSSCCRLTSHISPGVFERVVLTVHVEALNVDLAGREVRRACGLTSSRHVERWHGWMIPTEGHALLKLGLGRASTWETACVLFPTDGSAPATGGRRQKSEREKREQPVVFPSSHLYDFCFVFTPHHRLGTETWQTFLFVSRQRFDTVSANALELCWLGVPLLLNVQQ